MWKALNWSRITPNLLNKTGNLQGVIAKTFEQKPSHKKGWRSTVIPIFLPCWDDIHMLHFGTIANSVRLMIWQENDTFQTNWEPNCKNMNKDTGSGLSSVLKSLDIVFLNPLHQTKQKILWFLGSPAPVHIISLEATGAALTQEAVGLLGSIQVTRRKTQQQEKQDQEQQQWFENNLQVKLSCKCKLHRVIYRSISIPTV